MDLFWLFLIQVNGLCCSWLNMCLMYFNFIPFQETNGGKSYTKLGYANIDLAEFAGGGAVDRKYLLEGYSGRQGRQDNSTLRVLLNVVLQSGEPCFKRFLITSIY